MNRLSRIDIVILLAVIVSTATLTITITHAAALDPRKGTDLCHYQVFTAKDGLPMGTVLSITQTDDGYLWVGTESGLARFDGVKFDLYLSDDTPALTSDYITRLLAVKDGSLWIATWGGGAVRYRNGKFENFSSKTGIPGDDIWEIIEARDGTLWIGSEKGLIQFTGEEFHKITPPGNKFSSLIKALMEDQGGRIWVGTWGEGLSRLSKRGYSFEWETIREFDGLKISDILEDHRGTTWVGTIERGLICLSQEKKISYFSEIKKKQFRVKCLFEDRGGNIWIGTEDSGIHVIPAGTDEIIPFNTSGVIFSSYIQGFYEDKERTLWAVSEGGGLASFRSTRIVTYTSKNGLSNDILFGVFQDSSGLIWTGTKGFGVNYLKGDRFSTLTTADGLPSNFVICINEQPRGTLWFGTQGGGVCRRENGVIKIYNTRDGLNDDFVRSIYADPNGDIWIGTDNGGVHRWENGKFVLVHNLESRINAILKDKKNNLWVGASSLKGIYCFPPGKTTEPEEHFLVLPRRRTTSFLEDDDGVIWISTYGHGLYFIKDGKIVQIVKKHGLPDNSLYCILEDNKHNLWISTNSGIISIQRNELDAFMAGKITRLHPQLFGVEDGMKDIECNGGNQPGAWKTADGRLWFPTTRGLSVIDPARLSINSVSPPVAVKKLVVDGKTYFPLKPLIIPPGKRNVEIDYAGLSFIMPEKMSYRYKLEGFDSQWKDAGNRRTASYTGLPPGQYTFRVAACNSDDVWNKEGASCRFTLDHRYYETLAFKILFPPFVLFMIFAGYLGMKRSFLFIKKRKRYKKSQLDPAFVNDCVKKILYLAQVERVYRDANISLLAFSRKIKVSPRVLSLVINERLNTSFFELINRYRVEEAQKMLENVEFHRQSILDIAYAVGFNSKTAFNRAFRLFTHQTPSQYRKKYHTPPRLIA